MMFSSITTASNDQTAGFGKRREKARDLTKDHPPQHSLELSQRESGVIDTVSHPLSL
jgi:hypothetical protein